MRKSQEKGVLLINKSKSMVRTVKFQAEAQEDEDDSGP
jgi:hypothetical protein